MEKAGLAATIVAAGGALLLASRRASRGSLETARKTVLVCGGAGYIGSHTVLVLLEGGFDVVALDSLANSSEEGLRRVRILSGVDESRLKFRKVDLCDQVALRAILASCPPLCACIHFAGLKAVGESVREPLLYYENNLLSTLNLLRVLQENTACRKFIFSSSATVYGNTPAPLTEESEAGHGITNPYGRTKFFIEEILRDFCMAPAHADEWRVEVLRYFNPIGAHPSGLIGEDPSGPPNNLMPYVSQVAVGTRERLTVYGNDYPTLDGTGVRDYIHVMDLAEGHMAAIRFLGDSPAGIYTHNLGTGHGSSVLEVISAMEKAAGRPIAREFGPRRPGDLATVYCDPQKAQKDLGWEAKRGMEEMAHDQWGWQSKNPRGYELAQQSTSDFLPLAAPIRKGLRRLSNAFMSPPAF
jgi:UDP-glucose 4-epimerase